MKGYFKHIELKYNNETRTTMKEYCNETKKLVHQQQRLKFILSCRSYGIIPNHTKNTTTKVHNLFKCNTVKGKLGKIENNFHRKILNLEISQTNTNIKLLKRKIHHINIGIKNMLDEDDYKSFIHKQKDRSKQIAKNTKETQTHKLDTLKEKMFKLHGLNFNENWFENKTNVQIPMESKWLLSLGKKFALPIDKNNFSSLHIIADVEQCIQAMDENGDQEKDIVRTKFANNITTFKRKLKNSPKEKFILTVYEKTKKFLKRHLEVIIIQADKGNKTVIMYKDEYNLKMEKLLDEKTTYRTIRIDPTAKLQRENNNIVSELHKSEYIDLWHKRNLLCSSAIAPRIYGLPKIHKIDTPLRPIVSSMQVPCYRLSKHVGQILKHIISDEYNIKNSNELKNQMKNIKIEEDEILISFDVVSLFTNIPVHMAIKNIMGKWETIKNFTKIPSSKFLKILNFCLSDNNYFVFNKKIYSQIFGMPMGNPLSPTIADIILDSLLDEAINELKKKNIHFKYIVKYVDDILAIIKIKDKDEILNVLNTYHNKIQFTTELEENKQIAYLDTKIHRDNNRITFDWYAKESSSGRLMNFNATQPKHQIINTAKNFIFRVLNISDQQFHAKNIKNIKLLLTCNSFPIKLIYSLIEQTQLKLKNNITTQNTDKKENVFFSVRFIPGLTDNKNIKTTIESQNICFAYTPNSTLSTIFSNVKAPIEKQQQCNVVYELECMGNDEQKCNRIYIGTTKRSLQTRMIEHKNDITKLRESTGLATHILSSGHKINFDDVKILDIEGGERKRYTIESLRIQQKIERTMNKKEDTDNINTSYRVAI